MLVLFLNKNRNFSSLLFSSNFLLLLANINTVFSQEEEEVESEKLENVNNKRDKIKPGC
jgi:hypothetical protein